MMANNNGVNSAQTLTAVADAISAVDSRNQALDQKRSWRDFWGSFWCFGAKQQTKRINPERNVPGSVSQPVDGGNPPTTFSLSILAPPSSPASILNSSNPSSVQSPAGFFSLSAISASVYSPTGSTSTMFVTGPYAHETQLVSPPVFSALTTEPSTAPFTPPPEALHLTTPSSPEVPFAQLFASLDVKSAAKKNGLTLSSPLTSPRYVATKDLQAAYQLYPGSPASHLISPKSAVSGSGTSSPFPDLEFPARWSTHSGQESLFPKYDPSKIFNLDKVPPRTLILSQDSEASCLGTSEGFRLNTAKWIVQSNVHCGSEQYNSTSLSDVCCFSGEDMQQKRVMVTCDSSTANETGKESSNKSEMEQLEANRASFGLSANEVLSACGRHSGDSGDRFLGSQLRARKSYSGDYASRGKCGRSSETQIAQLAFSDSGTNIVSTDCFIQSIDTRTRKDSGDGVRSSVVLESFLTATNVGCSLDITGGESQVTCSGMSSSGCSERQHIPGDADKSQFCLSANQKNSSDSATKEQSPLNDINHWNKKIDEMHPSAGDFKFDKVNRNDDLGMNGELWVDHKEKVTAESGMRNWGFFHMLPSEIG